MSISGHKSEFNIIDQKMVIKYWNFFKENVLHDFTTYIVGAQVNQIVNKYLNGYLVFAICFFWFPENDIWKTFTQ